nr:ATPase domain-containing protein [Candidatus Njordarchaeum guaymaensis]
MPRESTGITRLDEVIGGGFPRPSVVAIIGAPGCGTTSFCKQFVVSSLLRGRKVHLVPADEPDHHYLRHFKSIKSFDIESHLHSKRLVVMDLYGKFAEYLGIRDFSDLESVKDVPTATIALAAQKSVADEVKEELRNFNIVIDSLTAISPFIGVRGIHAAIHAAQNLVRAHNHILILTAHDGALEGNFVQALRQYADSVIRMRMRWVRSELKREMIIEKVSFTEIRQPVLEFNITDSGIEIL